MRKMREETEYCQETIKSKFNKPLRMSQDEEKEFKVAEMCHICVQQFKEKDVKVRDHCQLRENIEALHIRIVI